MGVGCRFRWTLSGGSGPPCPAGGLGEGRARGLAALPQMSKLDLSTREGMLKGGDHGVALVPGHAEESLIYKRITGQVKPAMPLTPVPALTNEEIAAVRDWINAGAPMSSDQTSATNENK